MGSESMDRESMIAAGVSPDLVDTALGALDRNQGTTTDSAEQEDEKAFLNTIGAEAETENQTEEQQQEQVQEQLQGFEQFGFTSQEDFVKGYQNLLTKMSQGEHKQPEQTQEQQVEQKQEAEGLDDLLMNDDQKTEITENFSLTMQQMQQEIEQNGNLTEGTIANVEAALEKAGLPKELLSDYLDSKKQVAVTRAQEIVNVFGDQKQAVFEWAKTAKESDANVKTIVESYNKAVKTQDIDNAKSFASILKNMFDGSSKKPINIVGKNTKVEKPKYNSKEEMQKDIEAQVKSGKMDMSSIVQKYLAGSK